MIAAGRAHGLAVLGNRNFLLFAAARLCSTFAVQMVIVAVGWQVYARTGRLLDLGWIGLSQFLPFVCLALFAGHAADVYDRRLILALCALAQCACAALLLAFAVAGPAVTWPVFTVLALLGIARAFQMPSGQSLLPNLVGPGQLGHAIALNSSMVQVATITGPSIAGAIYAFGGGAVPVYAGATAMLVGAIALLALVRPPGGATVRRAAAGWTGLVEGLRFVWHRPVVLGAMSLDMFAVLLGGAAALLPALTRDVLHAGPEAFGLLRTAPGAGAAATALLLALRPVRRHVGRYLFGGVALFGAMTVVLGLTDRFAVALAALLLAGAGDMLSVYIRQVFVQLQTPDGIRGRVSAVSSIFVGASNELGEFESGLTAAWWGLVPAIVTGGVLTLAVTLLWAWVLFPRLRRLDSFDDLH